MPVAEVERTAHPGDGLGDFYYERLPKSLVRSTRRFVEPVYAFIRRWVGAVCDLFPALTLIDAGKGDGTDALPILAGGRGDVRGIFFRRLTGSDPAGEALHRTAIWKVRRVAPEGTAATLIEADRCFERLLARQGYVAIPAWVLFTLDISPPWEQLERGWRRHMGENLRRIRKFEYRCETTRDFGRLRFFYERMFRPYIAKRHGAQAVAVSLGYMQNLLERGILLLVYDGEEAAGGLLISTVPGRVPMVAFMGIRDADPRLMKSGVPAAHYYHCVRWAKQQGYRSIDFGHTYPFLTDGLFSFKRRWGMRVVRSDRKYRTLFLSLLERHAGFERFLAENPMVCEEGGRLRALVYQPRGDSAARHAVFPVDRLSVAGLDGVRSVDLGSAP